MGSSLDIFGITHRYLEGDLTLDNLQEWLVPRLGTFLVDPNSTASELAGLLELCFADIAAGEADEAEVKDLIEDFIRTNHKIILANPVRTASSNAMTSIDQLFVGARRSTFQPA